MDIELVDTHTHLNDAKFQDDVKETVERARAAGVTRMINMGDTLASSEAAVNLAEAYDGLYAGARAHNLAMGAFCGSDPRLIGVAYVPLENPARALEEARLALEAGAGAIWVSAGPAGDRSTHNFDNIRYVGRQLYDDRRAPGRKPLDNTRSGFHQVPVGRRNRPSLFFIF